MTHLWGEGKGEKKRRGRVGEGDLQVVVEIRGVEPTDLLPAGDQTGDDEK